MNHSSPRAIDIALRLGPFDDLLMPLLEELTPDARWHRHGQPDEGVEVLAVVAHPSIDLRSALTPSIRWVHALSAGVDGIPVDRLAGRLLTSSRGASSVPIAEYVLAAMLAFEKRIPGLWIDGPPSTKGDAPLGTLAGRTVGIVGLGGIGSAVADRASAFDMRVITTRRRSDTSPKHGVEVVDLTQLLRQSDHLVLAAPATVHTRGLIGDEALSLVRHGVHLVNVSRGSLIDQSALLAALDRGVIARATLDVVEPEPLPDGHPFYSHPSVRLSPHVAWSSPDTARRAVEMFVANLDRWRSGCPLHTLAEVGSDETI